MSVARLPDLHDLAVVAVEEPPRAFLAVELAGHLGVDLPHGVLGVEDASAGCCSAGVLARPAVAQVALDALKYPLVFVFHVSDFVPILTVETGVIFRHRRFGLIVDFRLRFLRDVEYRVGVASDAFLGHVAAALDLLLWLEQHRPCVLVSVRDIDGVESFLERQFAESVADRLAVPLGVVAAGHVLVCLLVQARPVRVSFGDRLRDLVAFEQDVQRFAGRCHQRLFWFVEKDWL